MMALQLGRPSGIQDRDIDVELPLNIDVDFTDPQVIFALQQQLQIESTSRRRPGDEYEAGYDSITSVSLSLTEADGSPLRSFTMFGSTSTSSLYSE
jgi:hypothetical protein